MFLKFLREYELNDYNQDFMILPILKSILVDRNIAGSATNMTYSVSATVGIILTTVFYVSG